MSNASRTIFFYAHWPEWEEPVLMGRLNVQPIRGKEVFFFEFDPDWLKSGSARMLGPAID